MSMGNGATRAMPMVGAAPGAGAVEADPAGPPYNCGKKSRALVGARSASAARMDPDNHGDALAL